MNTVPNKGLRDAVIEELDAWWPIRDEVDLDSIDGGFYWRCCRSEVRAEIERFIEEMPDHDPKSREEAESFLPRFNAFEAYIRSMQAQVPNFLEWITEGRSPRMRDAVFFFLQGGRVDPFTAGSTDAHGGWLFLGVLSTRWTGHDVERELQTRVQDAKTRQAKEGTDFFNTHMPPKPSPAGDTFSLSVGFRLHQVGELLDDRGLFPLGLFRPGGMEPVPLVTPYVEIVSSYPLPPEGVIATAYDRVVREQHSWHLSLLGDDNRQTKDVAIRTWAIGLLLRAGMRFRDAERLVCDRLGDQMGISQTRFGEDRVLLCARVPEATPYVHVRRITPHKA